ncbi:MULTISPECIES: GntR family transcriptional regulator [Rhizobium/Agrobacterium group]|uniref:GntR family transcriptional regulator n=1 Tax=Rhizobium/Agrobacterium group TaxID=227290 RepID=UPI0008FAF7B1|nr:MULTISPECIES: GntR family transcriptional regulator [Rhizobium/Agrobacterium group]MCF1464761.1 GntR family transcriptional regulator [Allorhizobium ampelinum]MCF1495307.1 GntR family transcriptional regulator [Allorhizobium ampelinum]MUZ55364.1 FCD domain-containing protein [Agrobacterium vitis]MUZ94625.1 FCD domain-containing protein [Agrobacterium vitis]MVA43181.1 FCD domain-containing protein [Agrobacterium vitis]
MNVLETQRSPNAIDVDVTDLILHDILTGVLSAGSWLKQSDLERRYNCTRQEVRRALDRLALRRLVAHEPNRGYHVFAPDERQAEQISDIRIILETSVADRIVANATPDTIDDLRQLAHRFDELIQTGTVLELYEANLAFHRALLSLCGNDELVALVRDIRERTSSAPVSQWNTRARIDKSSTEHHQMINALAVGDVELFKQVTVLHIRQSKKF